MGFTGLARWVNAPTTGLSLIKDNILLNHGGIYLGQWNLSIKSYRSTLAQIPGNSKLPSERTMCTLTMNDNVFVLVEDPLAPTRADVVAAAPEGHAAALIQAQPHYRTTFLTLRPPNALEQLLAQLRAHWVPVRQPAPGAARGNQANAAQQITIDGHIFAIGNDWLVRAGNVMLAGGAVKGMLLEAEYLPLPVLHSTIADGTSELLSNLLMSVLPNIEDAKPVAVTISDSQWQDVLWDRDEELMAAAAQEEQQNPKPEDEDIYAYGDDPIPEKRRGDWVGVDRDRRSAYLIMGALRSEGML